MLHASREAAHLFIFLKISNARNFSFPIRSVSMSLTEFLFTSTLASTTTFLPLTLEVVDVVAVLHPTFQIKFCRGLLTILVYCRN